MKIKERKEFASKPQPLTFAPDATVAEAVAKMSEMNYGSVVVVDDANKILGLVTERDLMKRLLNQGRDPKTTKLSDIMTKDIRVARVDDQVIEWLRIMSNERFRRLPVVDEEGRLKAIMTQGDFVSYTWPEMIDQAREVTKATVVSNYQVFLIAAGILIYSLILVAFMAS